jgi:hypothetical protein
VNRCKEKLFKLISLGKKQREKEKARKKMNKIEKRRKE